MSRYSPRWAQIALDQYDSLPAASRRQVDARLDQVLDRPDGAVTEYDALTDQWTITYGSGAGLLVYAVNDEFRRVLVLRLVLLS